MNSEEFKLRISEQFRQRHSPIHNLMLNNQPVALQPEGKVDPYREQERFFATQYGLTVDVELIKGVSDSPIFQLRFDELSPAVLTNGVKESYNLGSNEMRARVYTVEHLDVRESYMAFYIQTILLEYSDEFVVSYKKNQTELIATYNLKTEQFTPGRLPKYFKNRFREIYEGSDSYTEYIHTRQQADTLSYSMEASGMSLKRRKEMATIFDRTLNLGSTSMFSKIIENLFNLSAE